MSDEAEIPPPGAPPIERPRRAWRRLGRVCLVSGVVLTLLVAFLPALLSSSAVRRFVARSVGERTGASVEVDSWRFSWTRGTEIVGLRYHDRQRGVRVRIERITSNAGLLGLLRGGKSTAGEIQIVGPAVDIAEPRLSGGRETSATGGRPVTGQASAGAFAAFLAGVRARCVVSEGRIHVARAAGRAELTSEEVAGTIDLATLFEPIPVALSGRLVEGRGGWRISGTLTPPPRLPWDVADARADLVCEWGGVALGYVDDWLPTNGVPALAGVSSGRLDIVLTGDRDVVSTGRVSVAGLRCSGGVLGNDKLRLQTLEIDLAVSARDGDITIDQLRFQSPLMRGQFKGTVCRRDDRIASSVIETILSRDVSVMFWGDAAGLAAQLPETLRIRDGLDVQDGTIRLRGHLSSTRERTEYDISFEVSELAAAEEGRRVALRAPIRFAAKGGVDKGDITLDHFRFESSFADAEGKGSSDELSLHLTADLDAASSELGSFFAVQGGAQGELQADITCSPRTPNSREMGATVTLRQCSLYRPRYGTVALGDSSLVLQGDLRFDHVGAFIGAGRCSLLLTSDVAQASLNVGSFAMNKTRGLAQVSDARVSSEGDLGAVVRLLNCFGAATNVVASGDAYRLSARGGYGGGGVSVRESDLAVDGACPSATNFPGLKEDIRLRFAGELGLDGIRITALRFESRPLLFSCWGEIEDLQGRMDTRVQGMLTCDFAHAVRVLRAYKPDFAWELAGRESGPFSIDIPMGVREPRKRWRDTQAELPLRLSSAAAYGMAFGPVSSRVLVESGMVSSQLETTLNGGSFVCVPRLDLRCEPPALTLAGPKRVMSGVGLTQGMVDALLSKFHPVFRTSAVVGDNGIVDADVEHLFLPFGDDLTTAAAFSGSISLTNVVIGADGLLAQVLDLVGKEAERAMVPYQRISFQCKDGWVSSTPLAIRADVTDVTFMGRVRLDGTLDYEVDVPMTREMFEFDERLWKYLKDTRVKVVVHGTLDKPRISSETLRANYDKLLKQAMRNLLREESSRLMEKLFK